MMKKYKKRLYEHDQSVDFGDADVVQFFHGALDRRLVGGHIDDKSESVQLFNFVHCRFSVDRVAHNAELVHLVHILHRFARVFRRFWQAKSVSKTQCQCF